jgi:hypothetical protein
VLLLCTKTIVADGRRLSFFRSMATVFSMPADFKRFRQRRRYELERGAFVPDSLL